MLHLYKTIQICWAIVASNQERHKLGKSGGGAIKGVLWIGVSVYQFALFWQNISYVHNLVQSNTFKTSTGLFHICKLDKVKLDFPSRKSQSYMSCVQRCFQEAPPRLAPRRDIRNFRFAR